MTDQTDIIEPSVTKEKRLRLIVDRLGGPKATSELLGVSRSTLHNWLCSKAQPPFDMIERLAAAAGVAIDWVANGTVASDEDAGNEGGDAALLKRICYLVERAGGVTKAATLLSVSEQGLRQWMAGKRRPPLMPMARLARAAGASLDWLATGEDDAPRESAAMSLDDLRRHARRVSPLEMIDKVLAEAREPRLHCEELCRLLDHLVARKADAVFATRLRKLMAALSAGSDDD